MNQDLKRFLGDYGNLPRSIYVLFLVRIINNMGNFVYPFMAILLTQRLHYSPDKAGFFMLIFMLLSIPGAMVAGKLTDHFGRKKLLISANLLAAIFYVICGFCKRLELIPWLLIVAAFFSNMIHPISSAMLADLTTPNNRKNAYSLLYLGINLGSAIGPALAGFLYQHYFSWIFWGDALTTFLAMSLVYLFVPESAPQLNQAQNFSTSSAEAAVEGGLCHALLARPLVLAFSLIMIIFSFVYAQASFTLPLQVNQLFGVQGPKLYGFLITINAVTVLLCTMLCNFLTKRNSPLINIIWAGIFYALGFGMLYLVKSYLWLVISTIIWTIGELLSATNSGAHLANHTPLSHRGRFNAVLSLIMGTGRSLSPLLMGIFIQNYQIRQAWVLVAGVASLGVLLMLGLAILERRKEGCRDAPSCVSRG